MGSVSKGLHGLNKKVPRVVLERDLLSLSLQLFSLFVCVISGIMWPIFGFDSSIDGVFNQLQGKPDIQHGAGTHLSTLLNLFLIIFLISTYLCFKKITGFHNVIISVFVPIAGMMVFEFPWFILTDIFHNITVEGYPAIAFYGLGAIDWNTLIIGLVIIPAAVFYFVFNWAKGHLAQNSILSASIVGYGASFTVILVPSLYFGTPTVLIRNTLALFFLAFAHATFTDATENWNVRDLVGKYEIKPRSKIMAILFGLSILLFVVWVFWPFYTQVKGVMWPQTVYAFYENGVLDRLVWVGNDAVRVLNVLSKAVVTAAVAVTFVPKITAKGEESDQLERVMSSLTQMEEVIAQ